MKAVGSGQPLMRSFDYANTQVSNVSLCVYSDVGIKKGKKILEQNKLFSFPIIQSFIQLFFRNAGVLQ